ncbi:MAG: DUF6807 domain-containing protein [Thermoguttaceae bacterium]
MGRTTLLGVAGWMVVAGTVLAAEPFGLSRCEIVPLADSQVAMQIDGVEQVRWHFGGQYPRPFFFPFNGPSGVSLTRMGHPGAPNHDHHRSVWFAHNSVAGTDFWSDNTAARVRQKAWSVYRDGDDEAVMASVCGWYDGNGTELMEQELVAALIPMEEGEHALDVQVTMRPPAGGTSAGGSSVELGKTNFGFLAVRVAKTLSEHFGGGRLTSSEGGTGEEEIFAKPARWVDYSGPVAVGTGSERRAVTEGITYHDHPGNPRYPTAWHVRRDGWMGAAFCLEEGYTVTAETPLILRYLLHAHRGAYDADRAEAVHEAFAGRKGFRVARSTEPNNQFEVARLP